MMWGYGYNDWGLMGFGLHGIGMLLFWGVILFALFALVRAATTHAAAPARSGDDALTILRERYARGELSAEEFRTRRDELSTR